MTTADVTNDGATPKETRQDSLKVKQESEVTQTDNKATVLDIHGYRVGRTVGQGSYATVKEAYSQRHKCRVAIKIISKKKAPDDYLEKFLPREIDVVRLIKHPNLVVFLQSIETNNRVYLVMEYAPGGDLLDVIRQQKFIAENQAGVWFGQMVDGIDYCHQKGVVHRDLKCENILLDEFQNLKITDFGFARSGMKPKPGCQYLLSETYCGSYAYAPPEILSGTPYAPQFADIWSMGVILYVMVVGRLPFDDSNHRKLLKQVNSGPTFPEKREVSVNCKDIILKILVRMPNRPIIRALRCHAWFKKMCQPILDVMEKEANKFASHKTQSVVNANRNNANCNSKSLPAGRVTADGDADVNCDDATSVRARKAVYKIPPIRESSTLIATSSKNSITSSSNVLHEHRGVPARETFGIEDNKIPSSSTDSGILVGNDSEILCSQDLMLSDNDMSAMYSTSGSSQNIQTTHVRFNDEDSPEAVINEEIKHQPEHQITNNSSGHTEKHFTETIKEKPRINGGKKWGMIKMLPPIRRRRDINSVQSSTFTHQQ